MKESISRSKVFLMLSAVTFIFFHMKASENEVALVTQKEPQAVIVTSSDCPKSVLIAAQEFQKYIEKISKARLPVINDKGIKDLQDLKKKNEGKNFVFIGQSKFTDELGISPKNLKSDGYRIVTLKNDLVILGKDDPLHDPTLRLCDWNKGGPTGTIGCIGTLYGVYHFLESLGIRWYYPGDSGAVIPEQDTIVCTNLNIENAPYFPARSGWQCVWPTTPEKNLWIRKLGFGHGACRPSTEQCHPYTKFKEIYGKSHPEYFMLRDGKRDLEYLCFSNPDTLEAIAQDMTAFFKTHDAEHYRYYPFFQNDGCIYSCECEKCQEKFIHGRGHYGTDANIAINAAIYLSKIAAKKFPERKILFGAYNKWVKAPTDIKTLPENITVLLACGSCINNWSQEWVKNQEELFNDWLRLGPKEIFIMEYYDCDTGKNRGIPEFAPQFIDSSIKRLRDISEKKGIKVLGEDIFAIGDWNCFEQKYIDSRMWWFCLNYYITGKLLWNPDTDVNALLEEYYQKFYGPAAAPMKKFFTRSSEIWASGEHGKNIGQLSNNTPEKVRGWGEYHKLNRNGENPWKVLFTPERLKELAGYLSEAEKLAEASPYKERIKFVKDGFSYSEKASEKYFDSLKIRKEIPSQPQTVNIEMKNNLTGKPVEYGSNVDISYDKDSIYFSFECKKQGNTPSTLKSKDRDSDVYKDESVELFISPPETNGGYFQVCINPAGCILDKDTNGNTQWNPDLKVEANENGNIWKLKLSIPFSSLGTKSPSKGTAWRMNLYRNRELGNGKFERQAWAPTKEGYHSPDKFGTVIFK